MRTSLCAPVGWDEECRGASRFLSPDSQSCPSIKGACTSIKNRSCEGAVYAAINSSRTVVGVTTSPVGDEIQTVYIPFQEKVPPRAVQNWNAGVF